MLYGKDLILATKPFAKEIRSKSWLYMLSTILFLALTLAATVAIPFFAVRLFFSIVSGLLMVRMFIIYHDHQHHSILAHSKLARYYHDRFWLFCTFPYKHLEKITRSSS